MSPSKRRLGLLNWPFGRWLLLVCLFTAFTAGTAEARFGKSGSGGRSGGAGGVSGGGHAATAPGSGGPGYYRYYPRSRFFYAPGYVYAPYWFGWGFGYYPYFYEPGPPRIAYVGFEDQRPNPIRVTAAIDGQVIQGQPIKSGYVVGAALTVEERRFGFLGQFTGISVRPDDGSPGKDRIGLLNLHLTYALLSGERGRLRLEAGLDSAFAPSATFVGPGLGVSGLAQIAGPVGLEGAARFTPTPYTQVDLMGGLTLALGPVGLRGGWRRIWLDDQGRVEPNGAVHRDLFNGPYVGVSVSF